MTRTKTDFSKYIESFRDFPKEGVVYWDFTPLLATPEALRAAIDEIKSHFSTSNLTKIAAVEAKGFTIGSALALDASLPLVLIRKPDLVPGEVDRQTFVKEYGTGEYQVKKNQFSPSDRVLIIYDIMAGPGATQAAMDLVARSGATVVGCTFVIELEYLNGREQLPAGCDIFSLVKIPTKP